MASRVADRMERGIPDDCHGCMRPRSGGTLNMVLKVAFSVTVILSLLFLVFSLRTVPSAHLGLVTTFGHVRPAPLAAGMHVCSPFASVKMFSMKTTLVEQHNTVPTKEGLLVDLYVALLYHVRPDKIYDIYTTLGEDFESVFIDPQLSSEVRGFTSQGDAKELYNGGREQIQRNLTRAMAAVLEPHGIVVETALLKGIELPKLLTQSIEAKAQAEQEAGRMKFVLQKEQQEADRKTIEAKGIAEFQRIVSEGISPALLQWKGIEATEKFTASPNSKLVIMGNSKASLPVMFSGDVAKSET